MLILFCSSYSCSAFLFPDSSTQSYSHIQQFSYWLRSTILVSFAFASSQTSNPWCWIHTVVLSCWFIFNISVGSCSPSPALSFYSSPIPLSSALGISSVCPFPCWPMWFCCWVLRQLFCWYSLFCFRIMRPFVVFVVHISVWRCTIGFESTSYSLHNQSSAYCSYPFPPMRSSTNS